MYISDIVGIMKTPRLTENGESFYFTGKVGDQRENSKYGIIAHCYLPKNLCSRFDEYTKPGKKIQCIGSLAFEYSEKQNGSVHDEPICHKFSITSFRFINSSRDENDIPNTKELMQKLAV